MGCRNTPARRQGICCILVDPSQDRWEPDRKTQNGPPEMRTIELEREPVAKIRKEVALRYHAEGRPGKIEVVPPQPCATQRDLSLAYTPGVATAPFLLVLALLLGRRLLQHAATP